MGMSSNTVHWDCPGCARAFGKYKALEAHYRMAHGGNALAELAGEEQLRRDYANNAMEDIAEKYGVSSSAIRKAMAEFGIETGESASRLEVDGVVDARRVNAGNRIQPVDDGGTDVQAKRRRTKCCGVKPNLVYESCPECGKWDIEMVYGDADE